MKFNRPRRRDITRGGGNMNGLDLFNSRRLPARLTVEQASAMLGFHPDGILYLVEIGLIDALGGAPCGVQRLFAAVPLGYQRQSDAVMAEASKTLALEGDPPQRPAVRARGLDSEKPKRGREMKPTGVQSLH